MLINPWVRNYEKDDHVALGRVREWAAQKLDGPVDYGFGYGTWVFIGTETVIKIDPEVGRPERFSHELAVSGMSIARPTRFGGTPLALPTFFRRCLRSAEWNRLRCPPVRVREELA